MSTGGSERTGEVGVLVVDDDFRVAAIHARFVERAPGFAVLATVRSGAEALEAVEQLHPDLVLLDVHLPDLSGVEVLRRLRAHADPAVSAVGVIMITAAREADTVRAALHQGAAAYLVKPFEAPDLLERLQEFADTHRVLAEGAEQVGGQADIDAVFGRGASVRRDPPLPKGLSAESAQTVLESVPVGAEVSAVECADAVGMSRVSARRYLEHFVDVGRFEVRLRYGRAGRPQRIYVRTR
ncbi:response regulator [uncultured Nocardioides sp.]|uniref:response regulator n=1 Tax=uncultured Nocardioides sp. TaxID=198441 RepID=UPI0026205548|nr:response regulator [uncultured Nocardioides sp.]